MCDFKIDTNPTKFFTNLNYIQNHLKGIEKEDRNFNICFKDDLEKDPPTYEETLKYLSKRLAKEMALDSRVEMINTLQPVLNYMRQAHNLITDKYGERASELFYKLVVNGGFAEIYCFRKLVDADLNVLPDIKINELQVDAIIPITSDSVIVCECTLSERLKDIQKVKDELRNLGFRCKAVGITRESFCKPPSFDGILTFQDLNNRAKVISILLSLI